MLIFKLFCLYFIRVAKSEELQGQHLCFHGGLHNSQKEALAAIAHVTPSPTVPVP